MKQNTPKWLEKVQENSWELEILISGGAIFTLFHVSDIWIEWLTNTGVTTNLPGRTIILLLGTLGLETLKIGFILHLIVRAFWLSMVCVNYVFPTGIKKEKIRWKKPYRIKVEDKEDLQIPIIFVDRLCGIVMYLSIISTFLLSGILFVIFVIVSLPIIIGFDIGVILGIILFFGFLMYIVDLILGGLLRKIPYLSYLTFPFFTFYDYLTFRKIYQKSALLFYSNITKWKFVLFALFFFTIALTFSYLNTYKTMHWPNVFDEREYRWQMTHNDLDIHSYYYKDELPENKTPFPFHIQSKIIKDGYLEVFIQYRQYFDGIVKLLPKDNSETRLSDIFKVQINDSVYPNIEWFDTYNSTAIGTGITGMISIGHLENGKNVVKCGCNDDIIREIRKQQYTEIYSGPCREFYIPFWKDTN